MSKMMLQYPMDKEEDAEKVRGIMHMHTKHVKITRQVRATGVYGTTEFWIVIGMFILKSNAEIARKEIDDRTKDW